MGFRVVGRSSIAAYDGLNFILRYLQNMLKRSDMWIMRVRSLFVVAMKWVLLK